MSEFKSIGKILKSKGFDGTTIVAFNLPILDTSIQAFFIKKGSMHQPMLVDSIEIKDEYTAWVKWKNISSKEEASLLHNKELFLNPEIIANKFNAEEIDDLIGYEVYSDEEMLGIVMALYQTAQQETLEVNLSNGKKLLIPLIEEYILTIDDDEQKIYCELTPEFIDMFSS